MSLRTDKVNIIDGIASEYGIHRLGWYITQGRGHSDWLVQGQNSCRRVQGS